MRVGQWCWYSVAHMYNRDIFTTTRMQWAKQIAAMNMSIEKKKYPSASINWTAREEPSRKSQNQLTSTGKVDVYYYRYAEWNYPLRMKRSFNLAQGGPIRGLRVRKVPKGPKCRSKMHSNLIQRRCNFPFFFLAEESGTTRPWYRRSDKRHRSSSNRSRFTRCRMGRWRMSNTAHRRNQNKWVQALIAACTSCTNTNWSVWWSVWCIDEPSML